MSSKKKQTFLEGAFILMAANLLVKVIGAGFKIPLNWLIDDEGMGIFGKAYQIYSGLFVVATAGLPVAVSKMVSESMVTNDKQRARRILHSALLILGVIGIVGTLILYLGADFFAGFMGDPACARSIRLIAPAVLFVSCLSALRGFFQGQSDMRPTALSEVIESTIKLVVGLALAYLYIPRGFQAGAEGAVIGVTAGSLVALFVLSLIRLAQTKKEEHYIKMSSQELGGLSKRLLLIAIPISIGAAVTTLTGLIDMATISNRLIHIGFTVEKARELYGAYSGKAITLFNLPPTLISAISMSIVPAVAAAIHAKDWKASAQNASLAIRVTYLLILPCAVGLTVLSHPILYFLFGKNIAGMMLTTLAPGILFVSLVSVSTAILQASGRVYLPVIYMLIGGAVKIGLNFFLVSIPQVNINGAGIGTTLCYMVIAILNLSAVHKICRTHFSVSDLLKPLVAATLMGVASWLTYQGIDRLFHLSRIALIAAIGIGIAVYFVALFLARGIKEEEILAMPKGNKIAAIFSKWTAK